MNFVFSNSKKLNKFKNAILRRYQAFVPMMLVSSLLLVGYAAIDKEAPVIETDILTINYGEPLDYGKIQIEDNQASLEEMTVEYDTSTLVEDQVGTSYITVTATDLSNNSTSKIIEVNVVDCDKPTYELVEGSDALMEDGVLILNLNASNDITNYIMAVDNADGDVTAFITQSNAIDTTQLTKQSVALSVSDSSGNVNEKTFDVEIRDMEAPVVTFIYGDTIEIPYGASFNLSDYVTATDNSGQLMVFATTEPVDTTLAEHTYEIAATDNSCNDTRVNLTVLTKDVNAPVISCQDSYEVIQGNAFSISSYLSVVDNKDGDLTANATVEGTVDPNTAGTYSIHITATDSAGNTAEKWVTVTVKSNKAGVVSVAYGRIGCAYAYGASGPTVFDCSGFTQWVYRQNGISIGRTTYAQYAGGTKISYSQAQPGDLLFFATNGESLGHVGIYVGNGMMIHAGTVRTGVQLCPVTNLTCKYAMSGVVRY